MRIQRAHDRALAMAMAPPWPTGRGRMPEGPRPALARDRGVFSEMAPRNRALGDGGASQVHGPAWVRLGAVGERARCGTLRLAHTSP